jgi:mono/diheme cytochrome c family protein
MLLRVWLACFALAGCTAGSIGRDDGEDPLTDDMRMDDEETDPRLFFAGRIVPLLESRCAACHAPGRDAPAFLTPEPDLYTGVTEYANLINRSLPGSSPILTKGRHAGPEWTGPQAEIVRRWLELEGEGFEGTAPTIITPAVIVMEGPTDPIALDDLGLMRSVIVILAQAVGSGVVLKEIQVITGPTGAVLMHPRLVWFVDGVAVVDPLDRLMGMDVAIAPNTSGMLARDVQITDFPMGAQLALHFDAVSASDGTALPGDPTTPPAGPGCTDVGSFTTLVVPSLRASCTSCHAGGDGTGALDMREVSSPDSEAQGRACARVLPEMNPTDPNMSRLLQRPDPAFDDMHRFKFGSTAEFNGFRDTVLLWFSAEGM